MKIRKVLCVSIVSCTAVASLPYMLGVPQSIEAQAQAQNLRFQNNVSRRNLGERVRQGFRTRLIIRNSAGKAEAVSVNSEGTVLASAHQNGTLSLWSLDRGRETAKARVGNVRDVAAVSSGAVVVTQSGQAVSADAEGRVRNIQGGGNVAVAAVPGTSAALLARNSGEIAYIDASTGGSRTLARVSGVPVDVAVSPSGSRYAVALGDGMIEIGDLRGGAVQRARISGRPTTVGFSTDAAVIVGDSNGVLSTLDANTGGVSRPPVRMHQGAVSAISVLNSGEVVSGGADGTIARIGTSGSAQRIGSGGQPILAMAVDPDGRGAFVSQETGSSSSLELVDLEQRRLLVNLDATQTGAIVHSPEGAIDGDYEHLADAAVQLSSGSSVVEIDARQMDETNREPALLAKVLNRESLSASRPILLNGGDLTPPPSVQVITPASARTDAPVPIRVRVDDAFGAGVQEVSVRVNGKSYVASGSGSSGEVTVPATLLAGVNVVEAEVTTSQGVSAKSAPVQVSAAGNSAPPQVHILSIGVGNYPFPGDALPLAPIDARDFNAAMQTAASSIYRVASSTALIDSNATPSRIISALDNLSQVAPQDIVVISVSGHGQRGRDGIWRFFPFPDRALGSLSILSDSPATAALGISATDLFDAINRIPAQRVVVLLDACNAGAVTGQLSAAAIRSRDGAIASEEMFYVAEEAARKDGLYVIAASSAEGVTIDYIRDGANQVLNKNGVFMTAVLRGLGKKQGDANLRSDINRDGQVVTNEFGEFVAQDAVGFLEYVRDKAPDLFAGTRGGIGSLAETRVYEARSPFSIASR